jgi:hypothetical protein
MGTPYKVAVAPLAAKAISDLLTGTTEAAQELRDVLDAQIKVGGVMGEVISDATLAQFPIVWNTLVAATSGAVASTEIDAESA